MRTREVQQANMTNQLRESSDYGSREIVMLLPSSDTAKCVGKLARRMD